MGLFVISAINVVTFIQTCVISFQSHVLAT